MLDAEMLHPVLSVRTALMVMVTSSILVASAKAMVLPALATRNVPAGIAKILQALARSADPVMSVTQAYAMAPFAPNVLVMGTSVVRTSTVLIP